MTIEHWVDIHTLLIGEFENVDNSFDHGFGCHQQNDIELKEFNVIVYINNMDYDITKALSEKELNYFKDRFTEHAVCQFQNVV